MREGTTYQYQLIQRVWCTECGAELEVGSFQTYHQTKKGAGQGYQAGTPPTPPLPKGGLSLPGFLLEDAIYNLIPSGGVSGEGKDPDRTLDPFCTPPRVGHNCDLGGG